MLGLHLAHSGKNLIENQVLAPAEIHLNWPYVLGDDAWMS